MLGRYVAPLTSDGPSGWFRYSIRGCPSEDERRRFFFSRSYWVNGTAYVSGVRSVDGRLTNTKARPLSCMLALMPDDGLMRMQNWPHGMEIGIYAVCAGAVVRSHRSKYRTTISAPCITTALLLLLCDTDQLFPCVSRHLSRTHTHTHKSDFLAF